MTSARALIVVATMPVLLLTACGTQPTATSPLATTVSKALPRGVMSAHRACSLVLKRPRGTFVGVERVHLVLTTYAKGEPVESGGDYSTGMPPGTLVWVVEVHAKAIHIDYSRPSNARPMRITDYSVVMNAKTGLVSDIGLGHAWPLPLWRAGPMISLAARC